MLSKTKNKWLDSWYNLEWFQRLGLIYIFTVLVSVGIMYGYAKSEKEELRRAEQEQTDFTKNYGSLTEKNN